MSGYIFISPTTLEYDNSWLFDGVHWLNRVTKTIARFTPRQKLVSYKPTDPRYAGGPPLNKLLDGAWALVTHESSVSIDALLAGVPVFVKQDSGPRPGQQGRIPDGIWAHKEFPYRGRRVDQGWR